MICHIPRTGLMVVVLVMLAGAMPAAADLDLRVDFGSNATNPTPNWNTFASLTTDAPLVDYVSGSTSHGVTLTLSKSGSTMYNGPTGSWNMSWPGPTWLDAGKYAASDCLYGAWNTTFYVTFKNLNPSLTYTLEAVSSSSTDNDSVPWRVNGGTWTNWQAKSQGYDQGQWLTWTGVTPDANNQIVLQIGNSTGVNPFFNAVRLYAMTGNILQVGEGKTYATVQAAANAAADGDTIEIYPGTYVGANGNAEFSRNNLTIRGVGTPRPILDGGNACVPVGWSAKGIFVIYGNNATVENLEFQNAWVRDGNGSGIRGDGLNLTVRNCCFHDNEQGILTGGGSYSNSTILLESCEFAYNGFGGDNSQAHQIYIGMVDNATIRYCYFHHSYKSQEIKCRAYKNYVLYNRVTCEEDGQSNYEVSFPQGGETYLIGNLIHQGPYTTNKVIVDYNSDGTYNPDQHCYVVNNTIVNTHTDASNCLFVRIGTASRSVTTPAVVKNNIFQGVGTTVLQYGATPVTANNLATANAYLAWAARYDFRLTSASTGAINLGAAPGTSHTGYSLTPTQQYVHPRSHEARPTNGTIDIGAYEYVSNPANQAPYVNAGVDQITTVPRYTVNLDGTVSDDITASPTILWTRLSGPGTVSFGSASSVDTTATFNAVGTHVLQLRATDGSGLQTTDTVTITVNPDPALGGTITLQNNVTPDVTYAGCEDTWMDDYTPNGNYGNHTWGNAIGYYAGHRRSLIKFNVSTIPSTATVTSAKLRVYMCLIGANRTLEAYQVLPGRSWTKLGCTWNNYDTLPDPDLPWSVAGCGGSGTDRASTADASLSVTTGQVRSWVEIPLTAALVQGWVSGTTANNGVLLKVTDESSDMRFWPENYVDRHWALDNRPQLVVTYSASTPVDLRVDFGSNATNPTPNWNTFATLVTDAPLVDYATGSTSHGITMTLSKNAASMYNGPTGSWNMSFPGPTWLDANKYAASDCIYGAWNAIFYVTFKNLNPSLTYRLEVISSSATDNDVVPWRVNGGAWTNWQAKGQGYDQGLWMTWTNITPNGSNQIVLDNNLGSINPFLNAVRLSRP